MRQPAPSVSRATVSRGRLKARRSGAWLVWAAMVLVSLPIAAQEKRPLVVGSEQDHPPSAVGTIEATAAGFTVELWQAVASEQKLAYTLRVRPFDELLQGLKAGDVDVLLNLAKSD